MDGKYKGLVYAVGLIMFCLTVLVVLLFVVLWDQRELVAWCVLGLVGLIALVLLASKVNEIRLRQKRFHHHTETPLDKDGYPMYLPAGAQPYYRPTAQPKDEYPRE